MKRQWLTPAASASSRPRAKPLGAPVVVVGVDMQPVRGRQGGALAVVDHLQANVIAIGKCFQEGAEPGHGALHLGFALEGGDRNRQLGQRLAAYVGEVGGCKAGVAECDRFRQGGDTERQHPMWFEQQILQIQHQRSVRCEPDHLRPDDLAGAPRKILVDTDLGFAAAVDFQQQAAEAAVGHPAVEIEEVEIGVEPDPAAGRNTVNPLLQIQSDSPSFSVIEPVFCTDADFWRDDVLESDHERCCA